MPLLTIRIKDIDGEPQTVCDDKEVDSIEEAQAIINPLQVGMIQLGDEDAIVWSITSNNASGSGEKLSFDH